MVKMKELECLRCGYKWIPRKENPKECGLCKRHDWNVPKKDKNNIKNVKGGHKK